MTISGGGVRQRSRGASGDNDEIERIKEVRRKMGELDGSGRSSGSGARGHLARMEVTTEEHQAQWRQHEGLIRGTVARRGLRTYHPVISPFSKNITSFPMPGWSAKSVWLHMAYHEKSLIWWHFTNGPFGRPKNRRDAIENYPAVIINKKNWDVYVVWGSWKTFWTVVLSWRFIWLYVLLWVAMVTPTYESRHGVAVAGGVQLGHLSIARGVSKIALGKRTGPERGLLRAI